ncbi:unnamed protein product [Vitrella brassicaformis CCMP3155]|uniref:mannosyl-oligosaccharide 1,2-alpha-mannosidase n=1 Tax=Vitrella brassicaformis (strain CCMP3155) TaxID=1169540 RepID=A0A0G4EX40_VITBC|nr:unnamed protein product [Vitrella brassicaformis CCMP3155]|eukprot:CEM03236.1 unnamed protein product [Vitrella brassicaformis CCMP3155]
MSDANTLLRPETVESLTYMIELKGRPNYFTSRDDQRPTTGGGEEGQKYILSTVTEEEESAAILEWGIRYRNWAWRIFLAIIKWGKGAHGFSALGDPYSMCIIAITNIWVPPRQMNRMDTFVIAETFKYCLIAFSPPGTVRLDQTVFNTEAHPLPVIPDGGSCGRVARHKRRSSQNVTVEPAEATA